MNTPLHKIQAAINAAEAVSQPLARGDTPITITQDTLAALLDGARRAVAFDLDD